LSTDILQLEIVYHDGDIVIVNKPGGLLSVPGRGPDKQDCISSRLQNIFSDMIQQPAVHRLDMFTSGLMVFARTREAHRKLSIQFEKHQVQKQYHALLDGIIDGNRGEIRLSFRLDPDNRPLQIYDPQYGKPGITHWEKLGVQPRRTRIEFTPVTGRTHQLRLHSAHPLGLGTPIIGDSLYGSGNEGDQMMLHATSLQFFHPVSRKNVCFNCPPPF
jgi:tRNA pseudouridine32 synthase/23S rRNA pseudouridine746 synthase